MRSNKVFNFAKCWLIIALTCFFLTKDGGSSDFFRYLGIIGFFGGILLSFLGLFISDETEVEHEEDPADEQQ